MSDVGWHSLDVMDTTVDATDTPYRASQAWVLWDGG
jgi:hypothetical protein